MAAPLGNKNAASKPFDNALKRAIAQDDGVRLRKCAESLLDLAASGEKWATEMLADRMDGKAAQSIILGQDAENPFFPIMRKEAELREQLRSTPKVGFRVPGENEPEYVTVTVPVEQTIEQVDPE